MKDLLLARAPRQAIAVIPVVATGYKAWLRNQAAPVVRWLDLQRFEAKPGSFCVVPDATGGVGSVIVGLSDPVSRWDLAALPYALPRGTYKLAFDGDKALVEKLALGWLLGTYRVRAPKKDAPAPAELAIEAKIDFAKVLRMAEAITMARDLINKTAEELGPAELAAAIVSVGKAHGAKVTQIVGDALLTKGYQAIHAVGRASVNPPRFIELTWGDPKKPAVTLLGKGVCFDTGGLNLKTGAGMTLMRKDMAGAACALATAFLIMENKLPVRLRLLVPAVENAIGGNALRPSDIVTMRNGLTVQIGNTDAEGRMVLADTLVEASNGKPDLIVDFSTLGPGMGIFGSFMGALYTHDDKLAALIAETSVETEDPLWRMPFFPPYAAVVEQCGVADLNSAPSYPYAGLLVAAHFLDRFASRKIPWVHLDFMAWNPSAKPGRPEGGEPMGVPAIYRMLERRFGKA